MKRQWLRRMRVSSLVVVLATLAVSADAQVVRVTRGDARHMIGFNLGYFAVTGEADRAPGDVLVADLNDLLFEIGDFSGFTFGGEWLYGIGNYIEVGAGLGYYQ